MFDTLFDMLPPLCAECQRLLAASPLGDLPPAERATAEQHLEICERCRHACASFEHTDALILRMLHDEAPEDVLALLSPEAAAVIRDLPAGREVGGPHAELLARLRAAGSPGQAVPARAPDLALAPLAAEHGPRPRARALRILAWARASARTGGAALRQQVLSLRLRLAYGGVQAQSPVPTHLLTARFRPRHRWRLHLMLQNFDLFTGVLLTLIVAVTVWPITRDQGWYWLWPLSLATYTLVKACLTRSVRVRAWYALSVSKWKRGLHALAGRRRSLRWLKSVQDDLISQLMHVVLAAGLLLMALVFTINLHGQPDAATWLLFSLPILWLSRYSSTGWIVVMTCLTTIFNVLLHVATDQHFWPNALGPLVIQTAWIVILCMLPTILARYVAEMGAGMHAAVDVVKEIARIRASEVEEFANVAAAIIARRMDYEHVNILQAVTIRTSLASERHELRLIGAASPAGRHLARKGFTLPFGEGVCGRAAAFRREQLVNDVTGAPRYIYVQQEDFRDTMAELAIPILIGNDLLGVLDLQATISYAFSEYDVLLLRAVVTHLGVALQHLRTKQECRLTTAMSSAGDEPARPAEQVIQTTAVSAGRADAHRDVRPLLEEIASVIRGVLGADLVVLYPTKPSEPGSPAVAVLDPDEPIKVLLEEPIWEGVLRTRVGSAASFTKSLSRSAVGQVLLNNDALFIDDARHRAELIARDHVRAASSFVEREGVLAVAALPLFAHLEQSSGDPADEMLGVMFVNFRQAHTFTAQEEIWCRALAHLAALALLSSRQYQKNRLEQRTASDRLRVVSDHLAILQSRAAEVINPHDGGEDVRRSSVPIG